MTQRFLLGAVLSTQVLENTHSNRENHRKRRGCVCNACAAYCTGLVFTRPAKCGFAVLISPSFRQTTPSTGLACSLQHFQSFYTSPRKHRKHLCINVASDPVLTHSITGSIAASLSVRICSSPLVTSFKAGPELLASTTCKQISFGMNIWSSRKLQMKLLNVSPLFPWTRVLWQKA